MGSCPQGLGSVDVAVMPAAAIVARTVVVALALELAAGDQRAVWPPAGAANSSTATPSRRAFSCTY
jgi:hypothetical protein